MRIRGTLVAPITNNAELKYCLLVKSSTAQEAGAGTVPKGALNAGTQDIGGDGKPRELALDLANGVKLEMVLIPAGEFLMGSLEPGKDATDSERPHRVRISRPFYLGKYLVTQDQWGGVMGNNPSNFKGPKNPVDSVSWDDCQHFCDKLNVKLGVKAGKFQLPSEAQWEYACRAGTTTCYCFGDDESGLDEFAWYSANSGRKTHPVGEKRPNSWGLYDMHGNVWEWCADWYGNDYYSKSPEDDPTGPASGACRVHRGGSWRSKANGARSAKRAITTGDSRLDGMGFRVSLLPTDK